MIEFYFEQLLLLVVFAFLGQTGQAAAYDFDTVISDVDSVVVDSGFVRYSFFMEEERKLLILNKLKVGEEYEIYLSGEVDIEQCALELIAEKSKFLENNVLRFNADKPIFELMLQQEDCTKSRNLNISVGCTSCETRSARYAPPGIETNNAFDPKQLIRDIFIGGDCFDVDSNSINFVGDDLARGYFSSGTSSINIEEGVILSTGNIANSVGPNENYNTGNSFNSNGFDQDLADMISSNSLYDVASIEFEFTPTTDQISFEFVFASEEYCEYVNSTFNDVFGFFISGPGFNGPFTNNAENIAIVPGTNDYIAINSVNHLLNANYYLNNIPSWQHDQIPSYLECENHTNNSGIAIEDIEFDGFTVVMTVGAAVVPCETYHIKLAIADVSDAYFDSAVFLKANSFSTGETANVSTQLPGGVTSGFAYEDCGDGYFVFERSNEDLSEPLTVHFDYSNSSTAIPGIDFEAFADSIVIPAGDSIFLLPVNIFSDIENEGIESLILELDAPCTCSEPFIEMLINDYPELSLDLDDQLFCGPALAVLSPIVSGGVGNHTFEWNTSDSTETIEVNLTESTSFNLIVTDECGNTVGAQSLIEIVEIPSAIISGYEQVCPENPNAEIVIDLGGEGPWEISYSLNGIPQPPVTGITSSPYILMVDQLGIYLLNKVTHIGCEGEVLGAASVVETVFEIESSVFEESCPNTGDGSIDVTVSGGLAPYQFVWDNGAGTVEDPENLATGTYNLTLTDANGCSTNSTLIVPLSDDVPFVEAGEDATLNCNFTELVLSGSGSQGANFEYLWTTNNGNILSNETTLSPLINQNGNYFLNITNVVNGCEVTDEVTIFIDTISPIPTIEIIGPLVLDCAATSTILDGSSSTPFGLLTFEWTTNDGNIISTENIPNPEVNAAGTYLLTVTNTINGCSAATSFVVDADIDLPIVNILEPMILNCVDTIIQLDAGNSSTGSAFEYFWESVGGNILTGNNSLFPTVDQPGVYNLNIVNTSNLCENAASVEVVQDIETPIAEAGLAQELDCNFNVATLDGIGSSAGSLFNYSWTTPNGIIISDENSLSPVVGSVGAYSLIVLNIQNGCSATDDVVVTENLDIPNGIDVMIDPPLCFGDFGVINILTVYGGEGPYLYSINNGEQFYSTGLFQNVPSGVYNLMVQDAEGCQYEEQLIIPQVDELILVTEPAIEIELGDSYQINAYVNVPLSEIDSIRWYPNESLSCGNCLNPVANPVENTIYSVTVFDQNGCFATSEILVSIKKTRKIYIPNAFSPNNDGVNDVFVIYADEKSVLKINRLQVFDRWGGKVFEIVDVPPNDFNFGWNGNVKGEKMNPSVFVYAVEVDFIDGVSILYKGDLTLLE